MTSGVRNAFSTVSVEQSTYPRSVLSSPATGVATRRNIREREEFFDHKFRTLTSRDLFSTMKKETISVLKPHNGKQSKSKVSKNKNKNAGNIQKKVGSPRGAPKIKIVNIEEVNIGDQLKNVKLMKSKLANNTETKSNTANKIQNGKKQNSPSNGKMAATRKDGGDETRAEPKIKRKINLVEKPVTPIKVQKKNKPEEKTVIVKNAKIKKQADEVEPKKEKKIKLDAKAPQEPTKEKKIKVETKAVQQPKKEKKIKVEKKAVQQPKKEKKIKLGKKTNQESKKKKHAPRQMRSEIGRAGNLELSTEHISKAVASILKLNQIKIETKKLLLPTESIPIFLQLTSVKIPKTPRMCIRPSLPHSMVGPLDDVALFVPDVTKGRKQDYEKTVDHWETILRQHDVDFIKEIIPINRVKTEYSQYELKRKLAASFDHFLVDGKITGHMSHLLGKTFLRRKGPPTPVKLDNDDLKKELENALRKTCLELHKFGNTHTIQIGTVSMEKEHLVDNIEATCKTLAKEYPGGWENIRAIQVKTSLSAAIPIYINLATKNSVKTPVVKPKRPRAYETVEGELTTIPGKTTVKMTPEGRVIVTRERDEEEDEMKEEVAKESEEENDEVEEESEDADE